MASAIDQLIGGKTKSGDAGLISNSGSAIDTLLSEKTPAPTIAPVLSPTPTPTATIPPPVTQNAAPGSLFERIKDKAFNTLQGVKEFVFHDKNYEAYQTYLQRQKDEAAASEKAFQDFQAAQPNKFSIKTFDQGPLEVPFTAPRTEEASPGFGQVDTRAPLRNALEEAYVAPKTNTRKDIVEANFKTALNSLPVALNFFVKPLVEGGMDVATLFKDRENIPAEGSQFSVPLTGGRKLTFKDAQADYNEMIQAGIPAEEAFWSTALKTGMDLSIIIPIGMSIAKYGLTRLTPELLLKELTISRDDVARITAGREGVSPAIRDAFARLSDEEKRMAARNILNTFKTDEPSVLGKIFGITPEEAKILYRSVTGKAGVTPKALSAGQAAAEEAALVPAQPPKKGAIDILVGESAAAPAINPALRTAVVPGKGEITLKPSTARTPEEIAKEAAAIGEEFVAGKPLIGKTELKSLINNNDEFKSNPTLVFNANGQLEFNGKSLVFSIKPEAMNLNTENLVPGDRVLVDAKSLKAAGAPRQTRIYRGDDVLGFNPKNLEDPMGPTAREEAEKIIKRSEIARELSEKLDVPLRRGKFNIPALGIYKTGPKVVRLKKGGLPTVFHEVGHYLDDKFAMSDVINIEERKGLMFQYGHDYANQPKRQRQEAFAEFLRFKMTGQGEMADKIAPQFSKYFNERMKQMPEVKAVIDKAAADYERWKSQPAVAKVLSNISLEGGDKGSLMDRAGTQLHNIYTAVLDDLHPLEEFSKLAGKTSAEKDPYILARNLRGWIGKADTFLKRGTFGKDNYKIVDGEIKPVFKGKSFQEIMKPIEEAGKMDEFRVYLVSRRIVEDLAERKIATGINLSDAKAALAELGQNPMFKEAAEDLYKYQDQLLEYAAENGLVGTKGLAQIKELNKARVPFYRVMEFNRGTYMGGKKITGNISSPIKKIKGSERDIIDPIESIIKDTYAIINAAERNNVGVAMANLAKDNFELGRLFEKVDRPLKPIKVNVKEVLDQAFKGTDIDPSMIPDELGDLMATIFRPVQDRGPNMLNVNIGDKQYVFQVEEDLFKAIQGLNVEDVGMIMRVLSLPTRLLRAGATLSPDFAIRNPVRDQFSAMVYSKFGYRPGYELARGIFEVFTRGDTYDLWKMSGGEHSMMVSLDREYLQKSFKEIMQNKAGKAFHYIKHPVEALRILSEIGEQATRLGEMKRALEAGANPTEAAFASREVTLDFARIGAKTKAVNNIVAFWNAQMQGLDKMARSFKTNPGRTTYKALIGITLPSILLYLANKDDPRWDEIPQWQKDLFWIVMTPEHIYRIPKPFELGIIFGTIPERVLEFIDKQDPEMIEEMFRSVRNGATPGWIPTAILPIIENYANYNFFLERPIVPEERKNLPAEAQYGRFTSEGAKLLGKVTGYSPAKIDNLVKGYTGGLGSYATQVLDNILEGTGVTSNPPEPSTGLEDTPVIKAFIVRPPVGSSSESVNDIYNLASEYAGKLSYAKKLIEEGKVEEAKKLVQGNKKIGFSKLLNDTVRAFSEINKARDAIRESETLSPDEKREKIIQLDTFQTELAQKVLKAVK